MSAESDDKRELDTYAKKLYDAAQTGEQVHLTLDTDDRVLARVTDGIYRQPASRFAAEFMGTANVFTAQALGLDARVMNGHELPFREEFDAVFTNAALHWMTHPDAVLDGVWRALKPGGRFVGECGGRGNTATRSIACWPPRVTSNAFPWPPTIRS